MSVTPSTVDTLYAVAYSYLQAIVAAMQTTSAGGPKRAFVAPGKPAFETECDQAAVWAATLTEGQTSPTSPPEGTGRRYLAGRVNLVQLQGFAIRCVAVGEPGYPDYQPLSDPTLDAQAVAVYEDGWAIWNYVTALLRAGDIFGAPCSIVHFDQGLPYATEGGLAGWQFNIRAEIQGYTPDLSGWPPEMPT